LEVEVGLLSRSAAFSAHQVLAGLRSHKTGFISVGSPRHATERGVLTEGIAGQIAELQGLGKTVVVVSQGKPSA
jgi:hypothetical protein